jgi:UDP-2,3-diacylglucosamine hydrolase
MSGTLAPYRAGDAPISLSAERVAVFTDLHLQPDNYEEIVAFARTLWDLAGSCDALVILGDLFESYIGREDFTHPAFDPVREAFQHLRDAGTEIVLLRGNRDVLLNHSDGRHLGFRVADSVLCSAVPGGLLLTHGDAFCLGDLPYQRLRRILRFPGMRPMLRALPSFVRRRLARRLRSYSVQEVARKPLESMHLTLPKVAEIMQKASTKRAWIGHLHAAASHNLGDGRELTVLPAWNPGTSALWIAECLDETA